MAIVFSRKAKNALRATLQCQQILCSSGQFVHLSSWLKLTHSVSVLQESLLLLLSPPKAWHSPDFAILWQLQLPQLLFFVCVQILIFFTLVLFLCHFFHGPLCQHGLLHSHSCHNSKIGFFSCWFLNWLVVLSLSSWTETCSTLIFICNIMCNIWVNLCWHSTDVLCCFLSGSTHITNHWMLKCHSCFAIVPQSQWKGFQAFLPTIHCLHISFQIVWSLKCDKCCAEGHTPTVWEMA